MGTSVLVKYDNLFASASDHQNRDFPPIEFQSFSDEDCGQDQI
jgi:hypothetical protein